MAQLVHPMHSELALCGRYTVKAYTFWSSHICTQLSHSLGVRGAVLECGKQRLKVALAVKLKVPRVPQGSQVKYFLPLGLVVWACSSRGNHSPFPDG
jgi:hypothetical protein